MNGSRLYIIILFSLFVIVFISQLMAPHKFVWKQTYDKKDKEPFGSYVFDDVLSSSINDYTVVHKTFYQLFQDDSTRSSHAFLLTEKNVNFTKTDIDYLYKIIHLGNQVMICLDNFHYLLQDTLHFGISYDRFYALLELNNVKDNVRDSIFFGTDTQLPERIYKVLPQIHPISIKYRNLKDFQDYQEAEEKGESAEDWGTWDAAKTFEEWKEKEAGEKGEVEKGMETWDAAKKRLPINCDSLEVLVWDNENKPLVIRAFIGKGELFIVTTPLMFTNFGMLDGSNASYIFRLLSYLKDKPLQRIEAYGDHDEKPQTPLRYVLSDASLRWAIYSILTLLLLFMALTAKRRQRIIPVLHAPPNRTLGFMQLISNLYYQKHDNMEILKMKYMYFCAEVKNLIGVELHERVPDETDYDRLVEKTGTEKEFISQILQNIRSAVLLGEVSDMQLWQNIDEMNDLLRTLRL